MTVPGQPKAEKFRAWSVQPGTRIGTHVIRRAIRFNGSEKTYLAESPDGSEVALAISLSPKGETRYEKRKRHGRFLRSVQSFLQLRETPGIARLFEHGMFPDRSESGHAYRIQEWTPGSVGILDWCKDEPRELKAMIEGWMVLAKAYAEMTRRGISHQELRPENILVTPAGVPRIVSFDGIGVNPILTDGPTDWMSALYYGPEVCRTVLSDGRAAIRLPFEDRPPADLHGLGLIFYQVLTGEYPFDMDLPQLFEQIAFKVPERPRALNPDVPLGLERVVMKLLEKEPENRYQSGDDVAADLEALLRTNEDWARPFQTLRPEAAVPRQEVRPLVTRRRALLLLLTAALAALVTYLSLR